MNQDFPRHGVGELDPALVLDASEPGIRRQERHDRRRAEGARSRRGGGVGEVVEPETDPSRSMKGGHEELASVVKSGMVQILGFSGNSTDRPRASTVEALSVAAPIAGSGTLEAVPAQHV